MANVTIPDLNALGANVAAGDLFESADISNANASVKVTLLQMLQGLTITPTTSGVLTIANSKTATFSNTLTFTGTDASSVAFGAGGTVLYSGGNAGTPSAIVLTNATGTAAGLTAGVASAVAVGGITGLGTGVGTFLATPSGANLATALTTALPATKGGTGLTALGTGVATALGVNANAGGGLIVLADPGADRIPFWDDSAGAFVFLTLGTGLEITDTTIAATGAGGTAVTAASAAAGAGLLWVSGGADRTATATDTVTTINSTNLGVMTFVLGGVTVTATGTELNYVDGVTSAIQTQLDAKQATITFGTGVQTALGVNVGSAGAPILFNGAGGTPSSMVGTNITAIPVTVKTTAANYTIGTTSAQELWGGVIFVTAACTLTIPAVAAGQSFTVITEGAVAVSVDPNASDLIVLDGVALSDGDKITNLSTAGDMAVFVARDATGWSAQTNGWTDTN